MRKLPIDVFSDWVTLGKDKGMEKNHKESVESMISFATKELKKFSFIDAGCGNGWVVRLVASLPECEKAIGIDGSIKMVQKAKKLDLKSSYICEDLMLWKPQKKVDLVHSMEVFYYLKDPQKLIQHVLSYWLKEGARLIIGLDFYFENTVTHSWPEDCSISIMSLFSASEWEIFFLEAGFKEVSSWRLGPKENWAGTLILTGIK
ncbi:MAG: SAM-dependent methyltransferase [Flavobacteriaceae bacterium]|jgi:SAM-dependent methyltransferase|tara:strand:- start:1998 stop:2609 length:612 start_codon:yes stop_codon:yes gene_type:complete